MKRLIAFGAFGLVALWLRQVKGVNDLYVDHVGQVGQAPGGRR